MSTESKTEEIGGRKRHELRDGHDSRGYVPMEVEALDAAVSAEALGLLLRIRRESTQREQDGELDALAVQAVGVYSQLPKGRLAKSLAELVHAGLLEMLPGGGVRDLNYPAWNRTRAIREERREHWRERKAKSRQASGEPVAEADGTADFPRMSRRDIGGDGPVRNEEVTPMSRRDMRGSHADVPGGVTSRSQTKEAEAEAEAEAEVTTTPTPPSVTPPVTAAVTPLPMPPEVADRVEVLEAGCRGVLVRPLKALERELVLGWASTLRRGGELVATAEVLELVRRRMAQPTPEGRLPVNLAWCADDVAALARERAGDGDDWTRYSVRLNPELAGGAP